MQEPCPCYHSSAYICTTTLKRPDLSSHANEKARKHVVAVLNRAKPDYKDETKAGSKTASGKTFIRNRRNTYRLISHPFLCSTIVVIYYSNLH